VIEVRGLQTLLPRTASADRVHRATLQSGIAHRAAFSLQEAVEILVERALAVSEDADRDVNVGG